MATFAVTAPRQAEKRNVRCAGADIDDPVEPVLGLPRGGIADHRVRTVGARNRRRWQSELNLRSLKIVLQMDHLRCKMPDRARNEFYMHLTGNNLIRRLMALAAFKAVVVQLLIHSITLSIRGRA
jgi:hypothetical protein